MLQHDAFDGAVTRDVLVAWYRRTRARTKSLFALIADEAYYGRPIPLRNPLVFYEGHLPAFAVNTLVKLTLHEEGVDERLETLFARGIDPEDEAAVTSPTDVWPTRDEVLRYGEAAERLIEEHLQNCEAAFTIIEHELMHQETLMYLLHAEVTRARGHEVSPSRNAVIPQPRDLVAIPAGSVTLGQKPGYFGWDNEFPAMTVDVPAFEIDAYKVTNGEYLEFLEATNATPPHFWEQRDGAWWWRGMFALLPLDEHAPVWVTHEEATRYARWKKKRLPTEAEWQRAAAGAPLAGNFDFQSYEPRPATNDAPSDFGVHDLYGNGWEWTSSLFEPFPGFEPMPSYLQYSADFFDGAHYVLKGASPVTPRELVRPSFRNWFRPNYPWVFAAFRCAR